MGLTRIQKLLAVGVILGGCLVTAGVTILAIPAGLIVGGLLLGGGCLLVDPGGDG